jgi:lipopolysaccharide export system permease protein
VLRIKTLDRYVLREVLGPFGMGLLLLTFALVTGRLLKLIELMVNHGVSPGEVMRMIGYIIPGFLELTFPMGVLLGTLLGFGRLSGDQELTAARASGISLYRLTAPVLALALLIYALSNWLAFSLRPWANAHLQKELYHVMRTRATAGLKEKVFNRVFAGLIVYVDNIYPPDTRLGGILISDERDAQQPSTIIASSGLVLPDERAETVTLRLKDGWIYGVEPQNNRAHVTRFGVYDLTIVPGAALGFVRQDPEEMSYHRLRGVIARARRAGKPDYDAESELAQKFTVPFATLLFAILGVTLGLKPARGGQSERFGIALAFFFFYYTLMKAGETLTEAGRLNAFVALGIPDLVFAVITCILFYRSATDRADQGRGPGDFMWDLIDRIGERREAA